MTELVRDAAYAVVGPAAGLAVAVVLCLAGVGVAVGRGLARSAAMLGGGAR